MARSYMTGYSGALRDEAGLLAWPTWSRFQPEYARRLKNLMDFIIDHGHPVGVGGGWRSEDGQRKLFLSRYSPEDDTNLSGDTYWPYTLSNATEAGRFRLPVGARVEYWEHTSGANAAPPGRSYHESTTTDGYCLAADMIGDMKYMDAHAADFGLLHFGNINGEPWHLQPIELPQARRRYVASTMEPLKVWGPTSPPVPEIPPVPHPVVVPVPTIRLRSPYQNGKEVATLQQVLKFWGWYTATVDGWCGQKTVDGIKAMQRALKLTADGVYGAQTAAAYKKFAEGMRDLNKPTPQA